jgi:hypothetical protein
MCIHTVDYALQVDPELRPNKDERERLDTIINSHSLGDHLKMLVLIRYTTHYYIDHTCVLSVMHSIRSIHQTAVYRQCVHTLSSCV